MITRERAIELLELLAKQEREYVEEGDYGNDYADLPRDSNYSGFQIWNSHSKCCSQYANEMDTDDPMVLDTLVSKYGFHDVPELADYLYDHTVLDINFTGNQYYHCENNKVEWGYYTVQEYETQITEGELFDYLVSLPRKEREELVESTDYCYDMQGYEGNIHTFDFTLYIGGAMVLTSSLEEAIQTLEDKE